MQTEFNYDKALADKLTIVLPLKGRPLFTIRYFLYMEAVKCPFKILIADGSLDEENKKVIDENKHRWPHVNFEYYRFPPDNTILDFQKKMASALAMIQTPYVIWNSNDDFYVIDSILQCIEFLEKDTKREYVACGGEGYSFHTKGSMPFAPLCNISNVNSIYYKNASCEKPKAYERIIDQMPFNYAFIQYAVLKTIALKNCYNLLSENEIKDLMCSEYFSILYLLSQGKFKVLNIEFLYCQVGCSLWKPKFLIKKIFLGYFFNDYHKYMNLLAQQLCAGSDECEKMKNDLINKWCDSINPKTLLHFLYFQNVLATDFSFKIKNFFKKAFLFFLKIDIFKSLCKKNHTLCIIKDIMVRNSALNEEIGAKDA